MKKKKQKVTNVDGGYLPGKDSRDDIKWHEISVLYF